MHRSIADLSTSIPSHRDGLSGLQRTQNIVESMPYIVCANPAMAQFPDVTNLAITMALSGGLTERSVAFYEAVVGNFAVVMGVLMQAGIIRSAANG